MIASIHLQYSQALPWVLLLMVGLTLLILFNYPPQIRQVAPAKRWMLPALRIMAASAIALSILRPVVTRQRASTERAPIVILFDDSRSMSVIDSARAPAELVGIAAALGKVASESRDLEIQALQTDCDLLSTRADDVARSRAELDYARLSGRGQDTAQNRLDQAVADLQMTARNALSKASASLKNPGFERTLASLVQAPSGNEKQAWLDRIRDRARAAAAMAEQARVARDADLFRSNQTVRDQCKAFQALSRLQLVQTVVFDPDQGLLARLGADTSVLGFGISDRVTPISMTNVEPGYQLLAADGSFSNLTGGTRAVLDSLSASPPRAVVLLSDGKPTNADPESVLAASLGVPIFTVGAASRSGIRDLAIQNVTVPSIATVGETINVHVELRAPGFAGTTSSVTITGGGPDETRSITFPDDRPIQFNRHFDTPGLGHLTLELATAPGEISYDNNRADRWINVQSRQPATRPGEAPHPVLPATRPSIETEMADLSGDENTLRRYAESTGGQFFRLDQIKQLARRLNEIHDDVNHPVEIPLWDGPYLLALVLGCLAAEWGLRKRYGLA